MDICGEEFLLTLDSLKLIGVFLTPPDHNFNKMTTNQEIIREFEKIDIELSPMVMDVNKVIKSLCSDCALKLMGAWEIVGYVTVGKNQRLEANSTALINVQEENHKLREAIKTFLKREEKIWNPGDWSPDDFLEIRKLVEE